MHKHMDKKHFLLSKSCETPYNIIIILDKIYQSDNSTHFITLFRELCTLHMDDNEDVHLYVLKFEELMEQLSQHGAFDKKFTPALFLTTLPMS